jgi:hypothetical protein
VLLSCLIDLPEQGLAHRDPNQTIIATGSSNANFAAIIVAAICSACLIAHPDHLTIAVPTSPGWVVQRAAHDPVVEVRLSRRASTSVAAATI